MNYRHAFHAGNFADCVKHALLMWLLQALRRKPAPFHVIDTHAGPGRTDVTGDAAGRTGEWRAGIGRLLDDPAPALLDYVDLVRRLGVYPGSPSLVRAMLRPGDTLACCELHPEDHAALRALLGHDPAVAIHRRDGYAALRGLLPPAPARTLVLIDPPYEVPGEYERVLSALLLAAERKPTAICAAWHPIKGRAPVRAFHDAVRCAGLADVVSAELWLREPTDAARLNGCGLLVRNPPYRFESDAPAILAGLVAQLGAREPGEGFRVVRLAGERG